MAPACAYIGETEACMTRGSSCELGSAARRYPFYNRFHIPAMIRRSRSRIDLLVIAVCLCLAASAQESPGSHSTSPS